MLRPPCWRRTRLSRLRKSERRIEAMRPTFKYAIWVFLFTLIVSTLQPAAVNAQTTNLWTGYYYNNTGWSGNPVYIASSQYISFNWGQGSPGPNVPADNFTATFVGTFFFYAGSYTFSATADDEVAIVVD